jgi:hypothetical protein
MRENARAIRCSLGDGLVEGSLNIILKRPLMLKRDSAIVTQFSRQAPPQLEWPGQLNGTDVWLHRWHNAPLHVMEVLSAVRLRQHLDLADGDKVFISIRQCDIGRIAPVGWLTWILFWFGRTRWTYTRDSYVEPAQRWGTKFGATQFGTDQNCRDLAMALVRMVGKRIAGARAARASARKS